MILLATLLATISVPLLWWFFIFVPKYKSLDNIPGPKPIPLIGNAFELGITAQDLLENSTRLTKQYGPIFKIYIANQVRLFISRPDLMEFFLSSNEFIQKSSAYDMLKEWLGDGLLTSAGTKWKKRRKLITPTFHFTILNQFLEVFNTASDTLVRKLLAEGTGKRVDIFPYINLCSLNIICETAMGVKIDTQQDENRQYIKAVKGFLNILVTRLDSGWKRLEFLFQFTKDYKPYKKYVQILQNFTKNVIKTRREELKIKLLESQQVDPAEDDFGVKRKTALLDMLLESEEFLTDEDIREEIDTFAFAGHDTTTCGTSYAILALAENPEVQEKVYEEIISVFGIENDLTVTMQKIQSLKYLDMVIKEALRIHSIGPLIERQIHKNCSIGEFNIPKGTIITLCIFALHRSEEIYPDPDKFDPERFTLENQAGRHNFAYVPFSAGPRNCIGQRFAMLEMKTIIVKIVRNFKILTVPQFKPELGMAGVLHSYNGIHVQLLQRNK